MTDQNRSHITLVVDRTGSMNMVRTDAEGAVRQFITDQQAVGKPTTFLFVQFDAHDPFDVLHDGDLDTYTSTYALVPRGSTPLLDCLGRAIVVTGERLAKLPEDERPSQVYVAFQTDGYENASREYTWARIVEMIKHQEENYGWVFIPLGTGIDAAQQFRDHLVGTQAFHNTVATAATGQSLAGGYANTSYLVSASRRAGGQSMGTGYGADVDAEGNITQTAPAPKAKKAAKKATK